MAAVQNSVLIIDDDLMNIKALMHILESDYTIYAEKNGASCLESAKKIRPDLILLDVVMPEISGFEVIEIIKADEDVKNIPVIFVTGKASPEDEVRGFKLGAVDYITKPFVAPVVKMRIQHQMQIINRQRI
jgi:PleD family two-component response regulator